MTKKLSQTIAVKVTEEMYSSLLFEAGGNARLIPDVIRQKIADSYVGAADVKTLMKQQTLLLSLLKHSILSNVPALTCMAGLVERYDEPKRKAEKARFEKMLTDTFAAIERSIKEAGL